jgi:hypothetical protein
LFPILFKAIFKGKNMSKIKYTHAGQEYSLNINKFKAEPSLDFIIDLINKLPEKFTLFNTEIKRDTIKAYIFDKLNVNDYIHVDKEQIELFNNLHQINIFGMLFRESYSYCSTIERKEIRDSLLSLLTQANGTPAPDLHLFIKSPNQLFKILNEIVDYNYGDFFLIPVDTNLQEKAIQVTATPMG